MEKYFYIKNNEGQYWHKFIREWKDKRQNVPAFVSLEECKTCMADNQYKFDAYYEIPHIVEVELSNEKVIEE